MTEEGEVPIAAELDFKSIFGAFDIPTMPDINKAFKTQFDDESIMCRQIGERYQGVFKVEATDITLLIGKEIIIREIATILTARLKRSPRTREKKGILDTLYDVIENAMSQRNSCCLIVRNLSCRGFQATLKSICSKG